jgi:hypothetical protein
VEASSMTYARAAIEFAAALALLWVAATFMGLK